MKKGIFKGFFLVVAFMLFMKNAHAEELAFCVQTAAVWQLLGNILLAAKVIIPIILIVLGTIDFAKAVINDKDDNLSTAAKTFLRRIVIGILIFFIPTIVYVIFNTIASAAETMESAKACNVCLNHPQSDECTGYKDAATAQRKHP